MNKNVLFVDDEPQILEGMKRNFRKIIKVHVAIGPEEGLKMINESEEAFAAIVSDMRMPGMDGAEFLAKAQELTPGSIRIMLTGNTDQETAIKAVNTGEIFKFLNKPCDPKLLAKVLGHALRQYQLESTEIDLLERTLMGSIETLTEILALVKPVIFGRVERVRKKCRELAEHIPEIEFWELDTAALLSQLGCVNMPTEILDKVANGETLDEKELLEYQKGPEKGADLIKNIPRLEGVVEIMRYQHKGYDGSGVPFAGLKGDDIPLGARILKVAFDFDEKNNTGWSHSGVVEHMVKNPEKYDENVLKALAKCKDSSSNAITARIDVEELEDGMVVEEDILSDQGTLLICRGVEINSTNREHLLKFKNNDALTKNVLVTRIPEDE